MFRKLFDWFRYQETYGNVYQNVRRIIYNFETQFAEIYYSGREGELVDEVGGIYEIEQMLMKNTRVRSSTTSLVLDYSPYVTVNIKNGVLTVE